MRLFGELSELTQVVFREDGFAISLDANGATTYTANRTFQLSPGDSSQILVSETATQTLTNKSMSGASNTFTAIPAGTALSGQVPTANGGTGVNSTATFPTSGIVDTTTSAVTLQNKTLDNSNIITVRDDRFTLQDNGDTTKQAVFELSGITTATTRTFTFPDGSTTLVGTNLTQTLTNKTLTAAAVSDFLSFTETTTPATPAAGVDQFYFKADGKAYRLNSAGVESVVGSGSGSGFKNYILNPNDAGNWSASGAGVTVATSTSASRPDTFTQSTAIIITRVSGTTAYAFTRFTLDPADYNKKLQIVWDQAFAGASGDFTLAIFSNTASNYGGTSTQIGTVTSTVSSGTLSFNTTFDSPGSAAPYMELRIIGAAGTTPLYLNGVTVTPGQVVQGAAVGTVGNFTIVPTTATLTSFASIGLGTPTTTLVQVERVGSWARIHGRFTTGTCTSTPFALILPTGMTIDTTKLSSATFGQNLGKINFTNNDNTQQGIFASNLEATIFYDGSTSDRIFAAYTDTTGNILSKDLATSLFAGNPTPATFWFDIPVAEWAGSGSVNLGPGAQVEYAYTSGAWNGDSSVTAYGPQGQQFGGTLSAAATKTITFQYPIQQGDIIMVEGSNNGSSWFPLEGMEVGISAPVIVNTSMNSNDVIQSGFILRTTGLTTSQISVVFRVAVNAANDDSPTSNWPTDGFWRVRKSSASAPTGFGLAGTDGSSGLYKPGSAPGQITGATIGSGYVGQVITATGTNVSTSGSNVSTQITTVSLTAGIWKLTAGGAFQLNGATVADQEQQMALTTASGVNGTVPGKDKMQYSQGLATSANTVPYSFSGYTVNISATTSYYLNGQAKYSAGTPQFSGWIEAVRIA